VLELAAEDAAAVKMLLAGDPVTAGALGLDLTQRLLRAGVVVAT
jgi:hypothetical protein